MKIIKFAASSSSSITQAALFLSSAPQESGFKPNSLDKCMYGGERPNEHPTQKNEVFGLWRKVT
jgi:hypothetical protein